MEISIILALMAIALAVFAVGFPNIPESVLSRMFWGRNPRTKEDILVIKRFLGYMSMIGFVMFIILLVLLIINLTKSPANYIASLLNWDLKYSPITLQIIFGVISLLPIGFIIWWAWKKAVNSVRNQPIIQTNEESSNIETPIGSKSLDNNNFKIDTANIASMNDAQLKVLNNYINYLKKKQGEEK